LINREDKHINYSSRGVWYGTYSCWYFICL